MSLIDHCLFTPLFSFISSHIFVLDDYVVLVLFNRHLRGERKKENHKSRNVVWPFFLPGYMVYLSPGTERKAGPSQVEVGSCEKTKVNDFRKIKWAISNNNETSDFVILMLPLNIVVSGSESR